MKFLVRQRWAYLLATLFMASHTLADQCTNVFSDAVGSYHSGGSLKIERNASIRNTDGVLDFSNGAIEDKTSGFSCIVQDCQASGSTTAELDLPSFKHSSSGQDFKLERNQIDILEAGQYAQVELKENTQVYFITPNSEYRIGQLKVERNSFIYLAAGEYWIDSLELKENSQIIHSGSGTGPVMIYSNDVKFERNTGVNAWSDPSQMVLISYDDMEIKENTQVKAIVYVVDDLKMERNTSVTGSVVAKDIELKENAFISYSQASVSNLDLENICNDTSGGGGPELVAHYAFEETSWSGNNSVLDSSDNNAHGSPVGSVSSVLSNNQISCRAASFPSNTSTSAIDAINTGIDINDEVGTAGTIAFWFRSPEEWKDGSQDRRLFDASSDSQGNISRDPYFYAELKSSGRIEFGMEDDRDADRRVQTEILNFPAYVWVHLAFVFNVETNTMDIWVNGTQVSTSFTASASLNGTFGDFFTLYFGDNRSTYVIGTDDSAYGEIDEAYIYSGTLDSAAINGLISKVSTCASPTPEPIAHWSFDACALNGSNDIIDTINGYNGTSLGGASIDESGRFCQAATFFGNDEHLSIPHQNAFDVDAGAISFWFKRNSGDNGDMGLFSKDSSGFDSGGHLTLWSTYNRRILVRHQHVDQYYGYNYYLESGTLSDDEWHHVVYTWGGSGLALYVDNQLVDQTSNATDVGISGNPEPIILGADAISTSNQSSPSHELREFFDGSIDDMQFYAEQLSEIHVDEIYDQSSYSCSNCNIDPVLESHWTFDLCSLDGAAGEILDTGSLANHGTALGGPVAQAESKFCQGIQFLGNDEHVNIPHNANYASSRGGVSFWYRRKEGTSGDMGLFSKDSGNHDDGGHLTIWSKSNKSVQVRHQYVENNSDQTEYLDSGALDDGQWHHVMYTWGSNGLFLYVDNQLVDSATAQTDIVANPEPIILGASAIFTGDLVSEPSALDSFFAGDMDDVRVYSTGQPDASDVAALFNQSPYSCAEECDTTPVLESYWSGDLCSLSGSDGELLDIGDSNLQNHGTAKGGAAAEVNGKYCQAIEFAGNDEHVNIPHHGNYATTQGGVSFWFRRNPGESGDMGLFSKDSGEHDDGGHLTIWSRSGKTIQVRHQVIENNTDKNVYLDSPALSDGEWHHVFYTWGSSGMSLYVNNQLVDQESSETAGVELNPEPIILGASAIYSEDMASSTGLDSFFSGDIDDVRFYSTYQPNTDLVSEIYNLADYACTSCETTPIAWYQFEESSWNAGNTVIDSINNFNGSPIGSISPILPTSPMSCQAMDIPNNDSTSTIQALDTGINPRNDIGSKGSISFWYKADKDWKTFSNSDRRMLFDASQSDSQRFYLKLNRNGVLRFDMNDSYGDFLSVRSSQLNFGANEWVFIAVTWDLESGELDLYAKSGNLDYSVSSSISSDSKQLPSLRSLYVGDNRNNYSVRGVFSGSADGQIDNVRVYNFAQSETEINIDKEDNHSCSTQIHHYQLSFDPSASVCSAATLTVKACGDESCSAGNLVDAGSTVDIRYTDAGGDTNTIVSTLAMPGGTGTFDWDHGLAQTYTLSLANTSPSGEQAVVCSPANCEISFDSVELQLLVDGADSAIPRQIAQTVFGQTLSVQTSQSCNNLPSNTPLELAIECVDPAVCASGVNDIFTVGGVAIAENSSGNVTNFTTVDNDFNRTSGEILGDMVYHDAGLIRLHARVGSSTVTKEFVVAPAELQITSGANNPQVAGVDFGVNVSAIGSQGALLPGYQPGDLQMRVTRTVPTSGNGVDGNVVFSDSGNSGSNSVTSNGAFSALDENLLAFANGQSSGYKAHYTEAGQINMTVREHDYFGEPVNDNGTTLDLSGVTFIPDYFAVTDSAPSLTDTCSVFSYWGQPIPLQETILTLQSFNALGDETRNFTDWDIALGESNITEPGSVGWNVTGANVSGSDTTPDTAYDNQWQVRFNANLTFEKANSPEAPASSPAAEVLVNSNFFVHNNYADLCLQSGPLGACEDYSVQNISGANLRWGRVVLDNVFGGIDQTLNMTIRTEYFNASGVFITNTDDSCTQYNWSESGGDLALTVPGGSADLTGAISDVIASGTMAGGASVTNEGIVIPAPGAEGGVIISLTPSSADSWSSYLSFDANGDGVVCTPELFLQGTNANCNETSELDRPFATATFGQFRGNDRIIHWREVFR